MEWHFTVAAQTDKGTTKAVNQDSLTVKVANTVFGEAAIAVVCDGMGGLEQGDVASSVVVRAYEQWFLKQLPRLLARGFSVKELEQIWSQIANDCNTKIIGYSKEQRAPMGTTLTVILFYFSCRGLPYLQNGSGNGTAHNGSDICGERGCAWTYDARTGRK